jgi:AcrR family transcriptional regulator
MGPSRVVPRLKHLMGSTLPPVAAADLSGDTPALLLDAAERLVAEHGAERVSVRSINVAAGRNPAAVHYHFGSKRGLLRAVLDRRMPELHRRRDALMAELPPLGAPDRGPDDRAHRRDLARGALGAHLRPVPRGHAA